MPVPFDRVASRYDATRGGTARGRQIGMDMHRWLGPGPVLEIGVGTGLIAAELFARGHPVAGVDLSAPMLAVARERLPGRVVRADALALPVATGAVGNVVIASVLHLLDDIRLAVSEAARVLMPEGRLVIVHGRSVHDPDDIEEAMRPLARLRGRRPDSELAILDAARTAGLGSVADTMTGKVPFTESPDDVADRLEERVYSYLWDVDDETWQRQVVPAVDLLRDLPRPTTDRYRAARFALSVYAKP
ncbi:class I SAM-dependent methyltransferase [Rugosimonospora acidiphila]|uniref:Class I SAM-dependent methyltransferase n=1 Tax=Rugosimonospora acidiphila TaxID=556531 RepID=A0ABP9SHY9_9ACTN